MMQVKDASSPDFKKALRNCIRHGDFPKNVKDMKMSELIALLRKELRENMQIIEEWQKQNE